MLCCLVSSFYRDNARGKPWTVRTERQLMSGHAKDTERLARFSRSLEEEREQLRRHTRLMALMEEDPTPEQITTFREVSAEISTRIRALEAQVAEAHPHADRLPALRALHHTVTHSELGAIVDRVAAQDRTNLRPIVQAFISTARIISHNEGPYVTTAQAAIEWLDDVTLLLGKVLYVADES